MFHPHAMTTRTRSSTRFVAAVRYVFAADPGFLLTRVDPARRWWTIVADGVRASPFRWPGYAMLPRAASEARRRSSSASWRHSEAPPDRAPADGCSSSVDVRAARSTWSRLSGTGDAFVALGTFGVPFALAGAVGRIRKRPHAHPARACWVYGTRWATCRPPPLSSRDGQCNRSPGRSPAGEGRRTGRTWTSRCAS